MIPLRERAEAWIAGDPEAALRRELTDILNSGDEGTLRACLEPALTFGTAGLRGRVGPGPACMNRATVIRVTWALAEFLKEEGLQARPVIIGFDARPESRGFARDAAGVLSGAGVRVLAFGEPCPTPWVAFAVRKLGAASGIVVTASHNPRGDSGYKVYDDRGVQIISPWDTRIQELMCEAPRAVDVARHAGEPEPVPPEVVDAYFGAAAAAASPDGTNSGGGLPASARSPMSIAYTPLHGVGLASMRRALEETGLARLEVVESQAEPDGTFPTVEFPNPEEAGALDLLVELASARGCTLALANDPDADRFAVCVKARAGWRRLSGDEVGMLLGDFVLGSSASVPGTAVVASSIVSSPMLETLAASYGARAARTLTGFKWICRVPEFLGDGEHFVFGYEEALGYCSNPEVRDKDGISAAVAFVVLARSLAERESSVLEHLEGLYRKYGLWVQNPVSVRLSGADALERMGAALASLRASPPAELAGLRVERWVDYREGAEERPPYLGNQDLLEIRLSDRGREAGRVFVRPSGTEAKLKVYVHLTSELPAGTDAERLNEELSRLGREVARLLLAACGLEG